MPYTTPDDVAAQPSDTDAVTVVPGVPSPTPYFTALRSLFVMTLQKGVQLQPERFAEVTDTDAVNSVIHILNKSSLRGKVLNGCKWDGLAAVEHAFPVMAMLKTGHWIVIVSIVNSPTGPLLGVLDPSRERDGITPRRRDQFIKDWSGTLILCMPAERIVEERRPFGLAWFVPEIMRHRRYLGAIALVATMSNIVAFSTPLMFQILIDKVITHHSYQTLTSLMVIFGVVMLFDAMFSYVRQSLMLFVTNKIDGNLASRTFHHLLRLPMTFFEVDNCGRSHPAYAADRDYSELPYRQVVHDLGRRIGAAADVDHSRALQR